MKNILMVVVAVIVFVGGAVVAKAEVNPSLLWSWDDTPDNTFPLSSVRVFQFKSGKDTCYESLTHGQYVAGHTTMQSSISCVHGN